MSFTGYLLPFDQRAYWATIVGVNINGTGPLIGPYPQRLPARRARIRGDDAVALLRDPHAARAGADRRADRRAPVPRGEARHDRAAVAESRAEARAARGRQREPAREGGVPPRVRDPEGSGQAVLPLRRRQGLADGVRRDGGHHHAVARARRRARSEGQPDDDHLRAAAGVVLLLPVRAAARDQAAEPRTAGDDRRADARR